MIISSFHLESSLADLRQESACGSLCRHAPWRRRPRARMAALAMVSVLLHAACFDKESGCESWAEGGECEKNAAFMKEACPQACQICLPPPPIDEHDDPLLGRERAVMTTEYGEIVLGFYPTVAPKTVAHIIRCLLYTSPSPRDEVLSRMPSSA